MGSSEKTMDSSGIEGKVSNLFTSGGVVIGKAAGRLAGFPSKLARIGKSIGERSGGKKPSRKTDKPPKKRGLFTGGILKKWGSEKASIKVSIAKNQKKIEALYFEIGKRSAGFSDADSAVARDSVKELVDEVRSYENEIREWEVRLGDIAREGAEAKAAKAKKAYERASSNKPVMESDVKKGISNAIGSAVKAASFESASEKAIFEKVVHDLLDDDVEIRLLAAAELGKSTNSASIPILREAIGYQNVYLTTEIINSLININEQACLPIFEDNLNDHNYRVRLGSLKGVYKVAGAESLKHLLEGLKDEHQEVRKLSATLLGWVGEKEAGPALVQAIKDTDQEVVKAAIMGLSIVRDHSSVLPLIRTLEGGSREIREKIVHAIERITGETLTFNLDAEGEELQTNVEDLKNWWRRSKMTDADEALKDTFVESDVAMDASDDVTAEDQNSGTVAEDEPVVEVVQDSEVASDETTSEEHAAEETQNENEQNEEDAASEETDNVDNDGVLDRGKLSHMNKKELTGKCDELGVEYQADDTKAVLVDKLVEHIDQGNA